MKTLTLSEFRETLSDIFGAVRRGSERIAVTDRGKVMGAVVGPEDLELLQAIEDRADTELVRAALAESDERIPFEALREELGL